MHRLRCLMGPATALQQTELAPLSEWDTEAMRKQNAEFSQRHGIDTSFERRETIAGQGRVGRGKNKPLIQEGWVSELMLRHQGCCVPGRQLRSPSPRSEQLLPQLPVGTYNNRCKTQGWRWHEMGDILAWSPRKLNLRGRLAHGWVLEDAKPVQPEWGQRGVKQGRKEDAHPVVHS